jgi:hypothetical protein
MQSIYNDDDKVTVTVAGTEYRVWPATADLIERIAAEDSPTN